VNRESSGIDRMIALDDFALVIDPNEIRRLYQSEAHPEAIHPERVRELRVTHRDVARDTLVESELGEEPQSGSQPFLSVLPLFSQGLEDGRLWQPRTHLRYGSSVLVLKMMLVHRVAFVFNNRARSAAQ
jgi:hypothetical protein